MEDLYSGYNSCDALQIIDGVKNKNKKWRMIKRIRRYLLSWLKYG